MLPLLPTPSTSPSYFLFPTRAFSGVVFLGPLLAYFYFSASILTSITTYSFSQLSPEVSQTTHTIIPENWH